MYEDYSHKQGFDDFNRKKVTALVKDYHFTGWIISKKVPERKKCSDCLQVDDKKILYLIPFDIQPPLIFGRGGNDY